TIERNGTDLLLVVDTSKSMDADDVKPSRLERVKLSVRDLVDKFPGDRIGLVAFAGDAFVESPMTLDHGALLETVDALDTSVIARGGTNIGGAIDVATAALASELGHQKEMVLLTDGEDLEGHGLDEAKNAAAVGIVIDTIGVGSHEGEIVPAKDDKGRVIGVVRNEDGAPVRSRIDEAGLQAIAAAGHGSYQPLGVDGQGLERLYEQSLAPRAHVEASSRTKRVYSEWFQIPLALVFFGMVLDALLGLPWRRAPRKMRAPAVGAAVAGLFLFLASGRAEASVSDAARAYASGRFEEAAKEYESESAKNPKDPKLAFNAGDAAYRAGHYDAADAAFKRALAVADPKLQEHALYNQGNALYREGEGHKADAREQTVEQWKASITAYEKAMALDAKDADARFNRDFVKRKLKELEEKPKEEPKEKPKDEPKESPKEAPKDGKTPQDSKGGGGAQDQKPQDGKDGKDQPGQLSPRDARAMLGALRGEERRGISRGADAGKPTDDAPGKDW
ncbi:MAG: VWA domain-containing protein, partial [Polyangiaceae bacterium]